MPQDADREARCRRNRRMSIRKGKMAAASSNGSSQSVRGGETWKAWHMLGSSFAKVHIWRNHQHTNPSHRQVTDYTADDLLRKIGPGLLDVIGTIAGQQPGLKLIIGHIGRPDAD